MVDLGGSWLGTYWQEGEPTRFEATLIQGGTALSGSILDDNYLGEAQVIGEIVGRSIRFTKRYLTTSPVPVQYTGTISEDEHHMQGTWSIGAFGSGSWEAHRSGENLVVELRTRLPEAVTL
jgi:hypothetical protein